MEITEVRIKLMADFNDKLRAFCSITIDDEFVVRDLKIIEGTRGPFVAMPSRKLTERCPRCKGKNHYRAAYCNDCGTRLFQRHAEDGEHGFRQDGGRMKLHADIAHPINTRCREFVQSRILEEYRAELERAKDPAYRPADLDVFDEEYLTEETGELVGLGEEGRPPADRSPDALFFQAPPELESSGERSLQGSGAAVAWHDDATGAGSPPREAERETSPEHSTTLPAPRAHGFAPGRSPGDRPPRDRGQAGHGSSHDAARSSHDPARGERRGGGARERGHSGGGRRDHGRREGRGGPGRESARFSHDPARSHDSPARSREPDRGSRRHGPRSHDPSRYSPEAARYSHDTARASHDTAPEPRTAIPEPRNVTREPESEPEDNFGVGLFS